MADSLLQIAWDTAGVLAMLERVPSAVERRLLPEAKATADRVVSEAQRRVRVATGETKQGITVEPLEQGSGYAVVSRNRRMPNLPLWLEHGTIHMEQSPYFDAAVVLEQGPYLRSIGDALADELEGLGNGY